MKESVKLITFIYIVFIVLLAVSGSVDGIISEIVYFAAFLVPTFIAYRGSLELKRRREEIAGVAEPPDRLFSIERGSVGLILPLIAPMIAVVFGAAYLTSLLLTSLGFASDAAPTSSLVEMLIFSALIPALLEEIMFRYLPIKLLHPYSPRWCILLSSLYFALTHNSFFKMPYAFLAGIIFMTVDVIFDSVWPSIAMHLLNNVASIVWMKYCTSSVPIWIFISILTTLVVISMVFVIKNRREYKRLIKEKCKKGEAFPLTWTPIALIVITVFLAVENLFG